MQTVNAYGIKHDEEGKKNMKKKKNEENWHKIKFCFDVKAKQKPRQYNTHI